MSVQALHERAVRVVRDYVRCEAELLESFQEFHQTKGFRSLGHGSLFEYALSLGLAEGTAFALIAVARKSVAVPALKEGVAAGELTLSNARRIAPILTPANQSAWIERAKALPKAALERALAREFPREASPERAKPVSEDRTSLTLTVSNAPLQRPELLGPGQVKGRTQSITTSAPTSAIDAEGERRAIPAAILHVVRRRDQGQCTARTPEGIRCTSRRWLHIHHLKEVSRGGEHEISNLALLCASHHTGVHEKVG